MQAARAAGALNPSVTLLLLILGLVLGATTLVQTFHVLPYPNLFIRWCELSFAGLFLFETARSYQAPVLNPVAGWVVLAWLASAGVSIALAAHPGPALVRQAEWLTHLLFAVALWGFLQRDALSYKVLLAAVPAGFVLFSLYLVAMWFALPAPRDYNWFYGTPLIGHARHLGYYALVALLFSAAPLLTGGREAPWPGRLLALGALSICWGVLFWTGGRAALGGGLVGLALIVWLAPRDRRRSTAGVALAAAGIGLGLSVLFLVNDPKMGFLFSIERTVDNASAYGVNGFTTGRLEIWGIALQHLDGHWLFGLGPDGYRFIPTPHHGIQPHGMLVQFLVEWGVLGTLSFLTLLALTFRAAYRRLRRETDPLRRAARVVAFAVMTTATLHALVDGLYYHAQPLLFLFACFAVTLLPTAPAAPDAEPPPAFAWLTGRRTLAAATVLLALLFILSSNTIYKLLTG